MDGKSFSAGLLLLIACLTGLVAVFAASFVIWYQIKKNKTLIPTDFFVSAFFRSVLLGIGMALLLVVSSWAGEVLVEMVLSGFIDDAPAYARRNTFLETYVPVASIFAVEFSLTLLLSAYLSKWMPNDRIAYFATAALVVSTLNIAALAVWFSWQPSPHYPLSLMWDPWRYLWAIFYLNPLSMVYGVVRADGNAFVILSDIVSPMLFIMSLPLAVYSALKRMFFGPTLR